ncbi:MAG: DUF4389 domain-containing protein [Acidimicrobiales bacterium]
MPGSYPVNIEVTGDLQVPRWRPLVNWLLVIPHLVWLWILTIGLEVLAVIGWFVILFTGRLPESWGDFMVGVLRYQWRILAYLYAWTEEYPSFSPPAGYPDPGNFPAVLSSVAAAERNRLTVFFRIIMVIPQYIVLSVVGIAAAVVLLVAWFVVLVTGRWHEGMRRFCIGYYRWSIRVQAYLFLITDDYPPFSLEV